MAGRWLILVDVEKPRIAGLFCRSVRQDRSGLEARPSPTRWRPASLRDPLVGNKCHRGEHGTTKSMRRQERLDEVAEKLNRRPRKTLGFATPAEKLTELIDGLEQAGAEH